MRAVFLLLLLLLLTSGQTMDPPAIVWQISYGTAFYDVHETSDGHLLVAGRKFYSDHARTVFLFNQNGNLIWETGIPGLLTSTFAYWVEELSDGSFIATGVFRGDTANSKGLFLLKIDDDGNYSWSSLFDIPGVNDQGNCVLPLQDGFAVAGTSGGKVWVIRTDLNGDSLWSAMYEGPTSLNARRIVEVDDKLIVFATGLVLRILAYDSDNGQLLWVVDNLPGFLGSGYKDGGDMTLSTSDNGFTLVNHYQPYIVHTDSLGNVLWYYEIPYTERPLGYSINTTMDNGYIYCGMNTSFDPNDPESAWSGMVVRYDSEGQELWRDYVYESVYLHSIRELSTGGYIVCGGEGTGSLLRFAPETGIEAESLTGVTIISLSPIPFSEKLTVQYYLAESSSVNTQVYDLSGREVYASNLGMMPAGDHSWIWDSSGESAGCYLVRVLAGSVSCSQCCVLID